jgi:hypothetical protein
VVKEIHDLLSVCFRFPWRKGLSFFVSGAISILAKTRRQDTKIGGAVILLHA